LGAQPIILFASEGFMRLAQIVTVSAAFAAALTAGTVWSPAPAAAQQGAEPRRGVPYLTLRNRTGSEDPTSFYGDERSGLEAGYCDIGERRLDMLTSVAEAAPFRIPDEILRVEAVRPMPVDTILAELAERVGDAAPVLYTHGFYIDFDKGCRRATILQENAALEGRFLWYSWPSDGGLLNYTHDEADLYWSVLDLAESIVDLERRFGPDRVNLAGHSLGGRGIVLAIHDVAAQYPDVRLGDVVLLAPDMDFDLFARLLPRIRPIVRSITVYVASADRPLALSEKVHGYPRLGQTGNDVAQLDGVEVIDLSDLPVRSATGHLYHVYNAEVGHDLDQIFNEGLRADARRNLVQSGSNLWRLQPEP
jgi:esterase/lipase superfamily enzyme